MDEEYQIEEEDDDLNTWRGLVKAALAGLMLWAIIAATIYSIVMMD